jgi:hypothetical protein
MANMTYAPEYLLSELAATAAFGLACALIDRSVSYTTKALLHFRRSCGFDRERGGANRACTADFRRSLPSDGTRCEAASIIAALPVSAGL